MKKVELDISILEKIEELGKLWHTSLSNPKVIPSILDAWEKVIITWMNDDSLPLVIRKSRESRGSEIIHKTGRRVIISDNSFPQWVYFHVLQGKIFNTSEIKEKLFKNEIPFCFVLKSSTKAMVTHTTTLGKYSLNKEGWKLCHIDPVGLRNNIKIADQNIVILKEKFFALSNPKNMFLVPKEIGGIGEIQEFIEQQK